MNKLSCNISVNIKDRNGKLHTLHEQYAEGNLKAMIASLQNIQQQTNSLLTEMVHEETSTRGNDAEDKNGSKQELLTDDDLDDDEDDDEEDEDLKDKSNVNTVLDEPPSKKKKVKQKDN